jgi:uncharacterized membrane protein
MTPEPTVTHLVFRYAHISMGTMGLVSGAASMAFRKGSRLHRAAGNVFFVSMLILGGSGAFMAIVFTPNMGNVMGGTMACYLVATAWATVIRKPGQTGRFEIAAALAALGIGVTAITFAFLAATSPNGLFASYPPVVYSVFASIALLATVLDARMIARGGLVGAARTTRHLWRMCLTFFIATGSFFFGQPKFVPPFLRELGLVPILGLLPLVLLLYWLIRIRVWPLVRGDGAARLRVSDEIA